MPVEFRKEFPEHDVVTVRFQGWCGFKNGELMRLVDGKFDIFVTADQNLRYQQNLRGRKVAIIEVSTNDIDLPKKMSVKLKEAFKEIKPGDYVRISPPLP